MNFVHKKTISFVHDFDGLCSKSMSSQVTARWWALFHLSSFGKKARKKTNLFPFDLEPNPILFVTESIQKHNICQVTCFILPWWGVKTIRIIFYAALNIGLCMSQTQFLFFIKNNLCSGKNMWVMALISFCNKIYRSYNTFLRCHRLGLFNTKFMRN